MGNSGDLLNKRARRFKLVYRVGCRGAENIDPATEGITSPNKLRTITGMMATPGDDDKDGDHVRRNASKSAMQFAFLSHDALIPLQVIACHPEEPKLLTGSRGQPLSHCLPKGWVSQ